MRSLLLLLLAATPCAAQTWAGEFCNPETTEQRRYEIATKIIEAKQPQEFLDRVAPSNPLPVRLLAARGIATFHAGHFEDLERVVRGQPDDVELLAVMLRQPSVFTVLAAGEILAKEPPYSPRWNWVVDAFKASSDGTARALGLFQGWLNNKERRPAAVRVLKTFLHADSDDPAKLKRGVDLMRKSWGSAAEAWGRGLQVATDPYTFHGENMVLGPQAAAFLTLEPEGVQNYGVTIRLQVVSGTAFRVSLVTKVSGREAWWVMRRDGEELVLDAGDPELPRMAAPLEAGWNMIEFRLAFENGYRLFKANLNGRTVNGPQRLSGEGQAVRIEVATEDARVAIAGVQAGDLNVPDFARPGKR